MSAPWDDMTLRAAAAGAMALAFGGAPLGVLLVARRMSLVGDALSHGLLPGAAVAYLIVGPDPWALTVGALVAALVVAGLSSLLARTKRLPEDGAFAVIYLGALALGVAILGPARNPEVVETLLFGSVRALDAPALILAASAATGTLVAIALFVRGFVGESADPVFMRVSGLEGAPLHLLLMMLTALNLVAGFRAFGALMTVALITVPAAASRFWARTYLGQAAAAALVSAIASMTGLLAAHRAGIEPGAAMALAAVLLFSLSALLGREHSLLQNLMGRAHLKGRAAP